MSQGSGAGAGSFSDLTLIKKRVQEGKPWHQIAAEMEQSPVVLRIRYYVLEPWLRQGMGHRSSVARSESLSGFAKKLDEIFEAMVKDEPQLSLATVQGWYDQILLYSRRTRHNVKRQRERETLLSTPTWTPEMDAKLLKMESEGESWAAIEDELGMQYEDCLRRLHYARKMKQRLHGPDGVTPQSSIVRLHQHYDLLARQIWTPEIDEVIVRMREGETESTWATIGAMVSVDPGLCCSRYHSVLRPLVESVWSERKTKQLRHLVGLGESWDTISSTLGLPKQACRMHWKETRTDVIAGSGENLAISQRVAKEVESRLNKHGRIERFYTCQDWGELLDMTSRTSSVQGWKRRQLDWLNQHPAWPEWAENVLIQLVLRKGLNAWEEIATAVNMDSRMNMGKALSTRTVTATECRMHWKNLDMPVQRTFDSREWTASTRYSFWSAWFWCREKQQSNKVMGGQQGDEQFWNKVAREMGMPGGGEQCLVFFEDSVRGLPALDDKTITDHANQQIHNAQEKATQQGLVLRPKHWSVVFQNIVRQCKSRLGEVEWKKVAVQMSEHQWSTHKYTLDRDTDTSAFVNSIEWHWRHIHKDAGPPWSHSELKLLEQGIRECGFRWKDIWQKYLPWRTSSMIRPRWYRLPDCATRITVDEYETLLQAVDEQQASLANIDWGKVAAKMPEGWSKQPCQRAYEASYRHFLEQTRFTAEEDQWLLQNMKPQMNGSRDWKAAVDRFSKSGISAWQYRLRWCQLTDTLVS
ncbi:hypothetical protein BG015_007465 [Linnemannia schmuckeri]|uniref:Myb-like domain-containing protein n=1 Tax=Linnemannia schmuckeri TaxID=64567 RepID=A0A9P5S6C2_9FUNG|nr:hypothetical protein BG015_007465 [Linnemannia schmuckeri]